MDRLVEKSDFQPFSDSWNNFPPEVPPATGGTNPFGGFGSWSSAYVLGGSGNDLLIGTEGDDTLDGGSGNDSMAGGLGDDIYIVDSTGDVIQELIDEGTDEVQTSLGAYTLGDNLEKLTYTGYSSFQGTGNALDNVIVGWWQSDTLSGGAGSDTLVGDAGNDFLDGGTGSDSMIGGRGDDVYIVDGTGDVIQELFFEGTDEVRTTLNVQTLGDNLERLVFIGTGDFAGTGNGLGNLIVGGAGNDTLIGEGGDDTLIGGDGDDLFYFDYSSADLQGGAGFDTAIVQSSSGSYLELGASSIEQTYGGIGNDTLIGTGSVVGIAIDGGDGDDTLVGGAFADTLTGGNGADQLAGADGDDVFYIDAADRVDGGAGFDTVFVQGNDDFTLVLGGAGIERVFSGGGNDNLIAGETAIEADGGAGDDALSGSNFNDTLYGGDGTDFLWSRGGDDVLVAGAGNDTLMGGDGDDVLIGGTDENVLFGEDGNDHIYINSATLTLLDGGSGEDTVHVLYSGGVNLNISSSIEHFIGGIGDDTVTAADAYHGVTMAGEDGSDLLTGSAGNDTLSGGNGDDTLRGGDGNDVLQGGAGADLFDFSSRFDGNSGNDGYDLVNDFNAGEGDRIALSMHQSCTVSANAQGEAVLSISGFRASPTVTLAGVMAQDVSGSWFTIL